MLPFITISDSIGIIPICSVRLVKAQPGFQNRRWKLEENGERKARAKRREKEMKNWLSLFHIPKKTYHLRSFHSHLRSLWNMLPPLEQPLATGTCVCSRNQRNVGSVIEFSKQSKYNESSHYRITRHFP